MESYVVDLPLFGSDEDGGDLLEPASVKSYTHTRNKSSSHLPDDDTEYPEMSMEETKQQLLDGIFTASDIQIGGTAIVGDSGEDRVAPDDVNGRDSDGSTVGYCDSPLDFDGVDEELDVVNEVDVSSTSQQITKAVDGRKAGARGRPRKTDLNDTQSQKKSPAKKGRGKKSLPLLTDSQNPLLGTNEQDSSPQLDIVLTGNSKMRKSTNGAGRKKKIDNSFADSANELLGINSAVSPPKRKYTKKKKDVSTGGDGLADLSVNSSGSVQPNALTPAKRKYTKKKKDADTGNTVTAATGRTSLDNGISLLTNANNASSINSFAPQQLLLKNAVNTTLLSSVNVASSSQRSLVVAQDSQLFSTSPLKDSPVLQRQNTIHVLGSSSSESERASTVAWTGPPLHTESASTISSSPSSQLDEIRLLPMIGSTDAKTSLGFRLAQPINLMGMQQLTNDRSVLSSGSGETVLLPIQQNRSQLINRVTGASSSAQIRQSRDGAVDLQQLLIDKKASLDELLKYQRDAEMRPISLSQQQQRREKALQEIHERQRQQHQQRLIAAAAASQSLASPSPSASTNSTLSASETQLVLGSVIQGQGQGSGLAVSPRQAQLSGSPAKGRGRKPQPATHLVAFPSPIKSNIAAAPASTAPAVLPSTPLVIGSLPTQVTLTGNASSQQAVLLRAALLPQLGSLQSTSSAATTAILTFATPSGQLAFLNPNIVQVSLGSLVAANQVQGQVAASETTSSGDVASESSLLSQPPPSPVLSSTSFSGLARQPVTSSNSSSVSSDIQILIDNNGSSSTSQQQQQEVVSTSTPSVTALVGNGLQHLERLSQEAGKSAVSHYRDVYNVIGEARAKQADMHLTTAVTGNSMQINSDSSVVNKSTSGASSATSSALGTPLLSSTTNQSLLSAAMPGNHVVGENTLLRFPDGRVLNVVYDGKDYVLKQDATNPAQLTALTTGVDVSVGQGQQGQVTGGGRVKLNTTPVRSSLSTMRLSNLAPALAAASALPNVKGKVVLKPKPQTGDRYAMCPKCGNMSVDFKMCSCCRFVFTGPVKFFNTASVTSQQRQSASPAATTATISASDNLAAIVGVGLRNFYGSRTPRLNHLAPSIGYHTFPRAALARPAIRRALAAAALPKKVTAAVAAEETVTVLSSDDEDDASGQPTNKKARIESPDSSPGGLSQFAASPVLSSKAPGRLQLMENSKGVIGSPIKTGKVYGRIAATSAALARQAAAAAILARQQQGDTVTVPDSASCAPQVKVVGVRSPNQPCTLFTSYLQVGLHCVKTPLDVTFDATRIKFQVNEALAIEVPIPDITKVEHCLVPDMPIVFLQTTPKCSERLRVQFQKASIVLNYDPHSKDIRKAWLVFVFGQKLGLGDCAQARMVLQQWSGGGRSVTEIDSVVALDKYVECLPGSLSVPHTGGSTVIEDSDADNQDRSRSPTPVHTFTGTIEKLFTYPPPPATGGIAVTNEDLYCLQEGEFLNDVIIDFYLKYLHMEVLSESDRNATYIFSSFFYRRLTQKSARRDENAPTIQLRRYNRVKTWTKNVDLFSKDFVIIPVNESAHWYLAIICYPNLVESSNAASASTSVTNTGVNSPVTAEMSSDCASDVDMVDTASTTSSIELNAAGNGCIKRPCVLIFDSLAGPSRNTAVRILKEYLQEEWNARKSATEGPRDFNKDTIRGCCPRCPQQTNFSDCGVYVLQYVESFFKNPIRDFSYGHKRLENWFPDVTVMGKRREVARLICSLQKKLNPLLNFDSVANSCTDLPATQTSSSFCSTPVIFSQASSATDSSSSPSIGESDPSSVIVTLSTI